ncbi:MAG: FecR domain-containing protein [Bacteroidales bacterium]|jgi:ferric-dicitrate binding protein FerR (iron transport regulator)|nr:FecR domain-containing protein [Bacteroidales bacterium]
MKENEINKTSGSFRKPDVLDRLPQSKIPWEKSREEVWESMQSRLDEKPGARKISLSSSVIRLSAAALILLLMGSAFFIRFYSKTVRTGAGEMASLLLPKGSEVVLNAETTLQYRPLWWTFRRELKVEGEAWFDVSSGREFTVISEAGTTSVLGTSFNIYSRKGTYEVSCYTGRVLVGSAISGKEVILEPEQKVIINSKGEPALMEEPSAASDRDWRNGYFRFTSTPVTRVFDEIARQYGINIEGTDRLDLIYTGNFSKQQDVNEVMNLVCKAFGIDFVKEGENTYRVVVNAD